MQLSLFLTFLAKSLYAGKARLFDGELDGGRAAADLMAKEARRHDMILRSSGTLRGDGSNTFASVFSQRGEKGVNQDCSVVWEGFGCQEDMILCGVFDGHGPWGHYVAKWVRESLPPSLLCSWQEALALASLVDEKKMCHLDIWKQSYFRSCASVDGELAKHRGLDAFHSGTTALTIVKQVQVACVSRRHNSFPFMYRSVFRDAPILVLQSSYGILCLAHMVAPRKGELMVIANVGDSRAVLATTSGDGDLVAVQLTTDFKPNLPMEAERIIQRGGRVFCLHDEPGVHRVWLPTGKTPGLAMSRAFGDYCVKDFGLISTPEVTQRSITSRDQFVVLATDGIWDVISNQEAVEIVSSAKERGKAAKTLVECAVRAWKRKRRGIAVDDCSAICLFFRS